ncbi:PREDICTED: rRNA methyltransferase 1, mitochondrial [Crocodylus porosus]|uniref:rRNA methyltransferase 1, mitochondrial n=1 Tax=Crocodylus porosus TaxID=8502 RepID=A0A7M4EWK6_CROPO|nr:PREDICTED: rRNA methyltransferase 1, mitochondrial [Crocodylus porosus]
MAFAVEAMQAFKFSIWKERQLLSACSCSGFFWTARCFSSKQKHLPAQFGPPGQGRVEGNWQQLDSHQTQTSGLSDAAQVNPESPPPPQSCKTPKDSRQPGWKYKKKSPGLVASSREEFRNLREDDFSKMWRQPVQKSSSLKRTKGSEVLFGIGPCSIAFSQAKRNFFQLFVKLSSSGLRPVMQEFVQQAKAHGASVHYVRREVLDTLCEDRVHQGVCLEASPLCVKSVEETEVPACQDPQQIWLVLEQIQDPMNLGAVLRSAYYLGVDQVVMSRSNSCPLTPVVSKASAGAMEILEVYSTDDIPRFLKAKIDAGWEVVGTVSKSEVEGNIPVVDCLDFQWAKPTVLVLGNEACGLSPGTRSLCHKMLTIPPGVALHPGLDSLNVSVATGVLLHSILRQKAKQRNAISP